MDPHQELDPVFEELLCSAMKQPRDESVLRQLSQRLEANPEEADYFLDYCRLHGDLHYLISSERAEQRTLDSLGSSALTPVGPSAGAATLPTRRRPFGRLMSALTIAASVAVVFGWYALSGPKGMSLQEGLRQPTIVAQLVSAKDVVTDGLQFRAGNSYREGSCLRFSEGVVKVNLPSGAEMVLQGPCDVMLEAPDRVRLFEGRLTARVAAWATDFEVETDSLRVINLGTRFSVEADARGNTEVHVCQGQVRVQPFAPLDESRTSFVLHQSEAVRIDAARGTETRMPAEFERFVTEFGDFRPFRPIAIFNTGRGLAPGDEDLHWTIIDGALGEGFQGPQHAVVCDPDERYLPNYTELSQWVSVSRNIRPGCLPNSPYTFRTEFDLSGYDLDTVMILADMLADNGVRAVRINGEPVDLVPWRDNVYLQKFHRYRRAEITEGFVPGKNIIEIDVWNGVYHFDSDVAKTEPTPNPMALRVEWQAFGTPLAQPATSEDSI